jgi:hypothetical protein
MKLLQSTLIGLLMLPSVTSAALSSENFRVEEPSIGAPNATLIGDSVNFGTQFESGSLYILPTASIPSTGGSGSSGTDTSKDDVLGKTDSIKICHVAGADRYIVLSNVQVLISFVNASIDVSLKGHVGHDGDIIPPFSYNFGNGIRTYAGHNWNTTNAGIYHNNCASLPSVVPTPTPPQALKTPVPVPAPKDRVVVCDGSKTEKFKLVIHVVTNPPCNVSADEKVDVSGSNNTKIDENISFSDVIPSFPDATLFVSPVTVFAVNENGEQVNDFGEPVIVSITDARVLGLDDSRFVITQQTADGTAWEQLPFEVDGDTIKITISRPGEILIWLLPRVAEAATTTPASTISTPLAVIEINPLWQNILTAVGLISGFIYAFLQFAKAPFSITNIGQLLLRVWHNLVALLTFKKRYQPWGTVYDSKTKAPLDPAYVELFSESGDKAAEAITDLDGRYGFLVPEGYYTMRVRKTNYTFPSRLSTMSGQDVIYRDLYFGDKVAISAAVTFDIPMDPVNFDWNQYEKLRTKQTKFFNLIDPLIIRFLDLTFFVGLLVMVWQFLHKINFLNGFLLGCYTVLLLYRFVANRPQLYGYVTHNGQAVAHALVHIFRGDVKVLSKVTDSMGRYVALVPPGSYRLLIEEMVSEANYKAIFEGMVVAKSGVLNSRLKV